MILIGYSGHGYVAQGVFLSAGVTVTGYCDNQKKDYNPFNLLYHGTEADALKKNIFKKENFFISIGNNAIRQKVYNFLADANILPANAVHRSAIIDASAHIAENGVMIAANVTLNPLATINRGVICNTGCIIEHECIVGEFSHIAPGAILCGNVTIGSGTFIGAGSVIRQGISIGSNVTVGAGSVIVKNIPDNVLVFGNPAKIYMP